MFIHLTYLKEMTEKEELTQINNTMKHCVRAVERIETEEQARIEAEQKAMEE